MVNYRRLAVSLGATLAVTSVYQGLAMQPVRSVQPLATNAEELLERGQQQVQQGQLAAADRNLHPTH